MACVNTVVREVDRNKMPRYAQKGTYRAYRFDVVAESSGRIFFAATVAEIICDTVADLEEAS